MVNVGYHKAVNNLALMRAGLELDDAVATKVVGIKKVKGIFAYWRRELERWEAYDPNVHRQYLAGTEENLPLVYQHDENFLSPHPLPYSTDLSCAFKLVEFMRKDGFSFKLWQPSNAAIYEGDPQLEKAVVSFICPMGPCERHPWNTAPNHHGAYDIEAETVPLAIARAAVLAKLCKMTEEFRVSPG